MGAYGGRPAGLLPSAVRKPTEINVGAQPAFSFILFLLSGRYDALKKSVVHVKKNVRPSENLDFYFLLTAVNSSNSGSVFPHRL